METKLIRCTLYITGGADTRWSLIPCAVNYNNKSASPPTNLSDSCQYLCVSAEIFWKYCSHGNTAGIQALTGTRVKASQSRLMDAPLYLSLYVIDSITCCSRGDWQLLGWLKFVVLDLEVNSVPVWWRLVHFITSAVYYHWFFFKLLNSGFCVQAHALVSAHVWPILPNLPSQWCLVVTLGIFISLSWCRTPAVSCGRIAALFISLVINITHCPATFAGNNADNGASALLRPSSILFFSRLHAAGAISVNNTHTVLSPGHLDFHSFSSKPHFICVEWCYL